MTASLDELHGQVRDLMAAVHELRAEVCDVRDLAEKGDRAYSLIERELLGDPDDDDSIGMREWQRSVDRTLHGISTQEDDRRAQLRELARWKREVATKVAFVVLGGLVTLLGAALGLDQWFRR